MDVSLTAAGCLSIAPVTCRFRFGWSLSSGSSRLHWRQIHRTHRWRRNHRSHQGNGEGMDRFHDISERCRHWGESIGSHRLIDWLILLLLSIKSCSILQFSAIMTHLFAHVSLQLPPGSMDFTKADISANHPDLSSVCGVCLLDVDAKSRSRRNTMDGCKIEQEGRFYHSACANFWVNCVDPKLPRLTYINISWKTIGTISTVSSPYMAP